MRRVFVSLGLLALAVASVTPAAAKQIVDKLDLPDGFENWSFKASSEHCQIRDNVSLRLFVYARSIEEEKNIEAILVFNFGSEKIYLYVNGDPRSDPLTVRLFVPAADMKYWLLEEKTDSDLEFDNAFNEYLETKMGLKMATKKLIRACDNQFKQATEEFEKFRETAAKNFQ